MLELAWGGLPKRGSSHTGKSKSDAVRWFYHLGLAILKNLARNKGFLREAIRKRNDSLFAR